MYKQEIIYDKPIYVGTSILDLSKLHMMNFHYGVIEEQFKDNYKLLYSDTDSFVYLIYNKDVYKWVSENKQHFDLSDSLNTDIKDNGNKKVLGMFKDELQSLPMKEWTALNPKVYSFTNVSHKDFEKGKDNFKKLKGISRVVVKNDITHEDYHKVLRDGTSIKKDVVSIRSFNHKVYTIKTPKIALTAFYDKLYMIDNNNCVPFGYENN